MPHLKAALVGPSEMGGNSVDRLELGLSRWQNISLRSSTGQRESRAAWW